MRKFIQYQMYFAAFLIISSLLFSCKHGTQDTYYDIVIYGSLFYLEPGLFKITVYKLSKRLELN